MPAPPPHQRQCARQWARVFLAMPERAHGAHKRAHGAHKRAHGAHGVAAQPLFDFLGVYVGLHRQMTRIFLGYYTHRGSDRAL